MVLSAAATLGGEIVYMSCDTASTLLHCYNTIYRERVPLSEIFANSRSLLWALITLQTKSISTRKENETHVLHSLGQGTKQESLLSLLRQRDKRTVHIILHHEPDSSRVHNDRLQIIKRNLPSQLHLGEDNGEDSSPRHDYG